MKNAASMSLLLQDTESDRPKKKKKIILPSLQREIDQSISLLHFVVKIRFSPSSTVFDMSGAFT